VRKERVLLGLASAAIGAALALGSALATGLLLYSGEGLIRALSVVLTVLAGSFAVGLSIGISRKESFKVVLRRRWRTALTAYVIAALYAASWSFQGDEASLPRNLGLGLAFLGALPCFSAGMVLGASAQVHEWVDPPASMAFAWAAFGFAFGSYVAGATIGGDRFLPPTLMMLCVVILSAGSLSQALAIRIIEARWIPSGAPPNRSDEAHQPPHPEFPARAPHPDPPAP